MCHRTGGEHGLLTGRFVVIVSPVRRDFGPPNMPSCVSVCTRIAALVLFGTGLLKLLDSTGRDVYYDQPDSLLFFLAHRQLMVVAAAVEIAVAAYVWRSVSLRNRGLTLLWLSCVFISYKAAMHFTFESKPCSCLGILGKATRLSNANIALTTWLVLAFLGVVGLWAVVSGLRETRGKKGESRVITRD